MEKEEVGDLALPVLSREVSARLQAEANDEGVSTLSLLSLQTSLMEEKAVKHADHHGASKIATTAATTATTSSSTTTTTTATPTPTTTATTAAQGEGSLAVKAAKELQQAKAKHAGANLTEKEEVNEGSVTAEVYKDHFKAMGGMKAVVLGVGASLLAQMTLSAAQLWMMWWSEDEFDSNQTFYLQWYAILGVVTALAMCLRGLVFALTSIQAGRRHHANLLSTILHAHSTYFDATPVGRVMNRFTKDTDGIDFALPSLMQNLLAVYSQVVGAIALQSYLMPTYLIPSTVVLLIFVALYKCYAPASVYMRRLSATMSSPVFAHVTESLTGWATIRAMRVENRFLDDFHDRLDLRLHLGYSNHLCGFFAKLYVGLFNAALIGCAAFLVVARKDSLSPANVGFILTVSTSLSPFFGWAMQLTAGMQMAMNSVERVMYCVKHVEQEGERQLDAVAVPKDWPSKGEVTVKNASMRYRPNLPLALKGLTMQVPGESSCGVTGRTGSGKSTLMLCLFRMYDLAEGAVYIDGIDIAKVGLNKLRRAVGIIPQDAVMFSGTIRENLDPFHHYAENALWESLDSVQLSAYVRGQPLGLDSVVQEFGANFSVGQRQLLCMARALLRKNKILVMDEATASVDVTSDAIIQEVVRTQCANTTVLSIAHRLHTIVNNDRVAVLEDGELVQYDSPAHLLRQGGIFAELAAAAGVDASMIQRRPAI